MLYHTSQKILSATVWYLGEKVGATSVTVVLSVILVRLLTPSDYGVVSLIMIMMNILNVFIDSGFGRALIQKKEISDADYGTVLIVNIVVCCTLYVFVFIMSPAIESYTQIKNMSIMLRVCGLILFISGAKNTIQAYIARRLMFKYYFYTTLTGTIVSGVVAVIMAYNNCGIWSLVAQLLINPFIDTVLLWTFIKWRPKISFSKSSAVTLFSFGGKILLRDLLNTIFDNIRGLFIGTVYSSSALGYYENGKKLPTYLYSNFDVTLRSVFFTVFSSEQNDKRKLKQHMLKTIRMSSFISFPLLIGLFSCAEQAITVIWTNKWIESASYLRIFCLIWSINSIQALNQQVILAVGRSDICLKQEVLIKLITTISIIIAVRISVYAIAVSHLLITLMAFFINLFPNYKLINCSIKEQVVCCLPSLLVACFMGCMVYAIGFLNIEVHRLLLLQISIGTLLYISLSYIFRIKEFFIIGNIFLNYVRGKHI